MNVFIALLLGLVQGLCEFLPISSSGHLVLLHNVFGIEEGALFFSIMLHIGTLLAVFAVYREQIWALIKKPLQKKTGMLLAALVPTVILAVAFRDFFESSYSGKYLGAGFVLTACLLLLLQRLSSGKKTLETMALQDALLIGLFQGVAILPGVSRSGATIAGGAIMGLEKNEAAEFSFLLSIPAILGSVVFELPELAEGGLKQVDLLYVLIGMAAAAASGYFAIRFMLRIIKRKKLWPFSVYLSVLGMLVLLDQLWFHIFFA